MTLGSHVLLRARRNYPYPRTLSYSLWKNFTDKALSQKASKKIVSQSGLESLGKKRKKTHVPAPHQATGGKKENAEVLEEVGQAGERCCYSSLDTNTEAPRFQRVCAEMFSQPRAAWTPNHAQAAPRQLLLRDLLKKQTWENSCRFLTMSPSFLFPNKGVQLLDQWVAAN